MEYGEWKAVLAADRMANRGNPKGVVVTRLFRIAQWAGDGDRVRDRLLGVPVRAFYRLVVEHVYGIELPATTRVGPGLRIWHGQGLVVNAASVIGANVLLRHGVTIGNMRRHDDCPVLEDDVEVGAGAVIVGAIRIGRGSVIGPNVVVTTDVPAGSTVFPPLPVIRPRRVSAAVTAGARPSA